MYSPFSDREGNPLDLSKIRFSHLTQLKVVDEGYKVEYKATFDNTVKDKIPAIVTSFSNSEGGWLIIGIEDISHNISCIPKLRSDYSQTISQLLKHKTSPIPSFDSRFLINPQNEKEGVLIVEVYEGKFPPYVANGTVYIRNGSSKEPIKSERSVIDYLYQKSQAFQDKLNSFCKRDIYFPNDQIQFGEEKITYPICNIYFMNNHTYSQNYLSAFKDLDELCTQVIKAWDNAIFSHVQHTFNSLVFRHRPIDPSIPSTTPTMELFYDLSAKIHIPMGFVADNERKIAIDILKSNGFIQSEDIKMCSGVDSFYCVFGVLKNLTTLYENYKIPISEFAVCFEMENSGNTVLFFEGREFIEKTKREGLQFCSRMHSKSKMIFLKDYDNLDYPSLAYSLTYDFFLAEFGFSPTESKEIVSKAFVAKYPDM